LHSAEPAPSTRSTSTFIIIVGDFCVKMANKRKEKGDGEKIILRVSRIGTDLNSYF
jgi:hypothetical protein